MISNSKPAKLGKWEQLRKRLIPVLMILFVIAVTVCIFLYRGEVVEMQGYGYLGAFLASLVTNATIILPVPGMLVIMALGTVLPPVLVGLSAGIGAVIGEVVSYLAGVSGRGLVENKGLYDRLAGWLNRWGWLAVFIFALTPLPFDPLGIVAGILRFPFWKFFLACWLGKTIANIIVAYAGLYGWHLFLPFFS